MASIVDKAHFPDGISGKIIHTNNEVRSNQYVHDYYHIAKGILPKGITDGVEVAGDTISDTITGIFTNTPWRRKITRDRILHMLEFEQINPLFEAAKETIGQISDGIKKVKSIVAFTGANTTGNRVSREIAEKTLGGTYYTPNNRVSPILYENDTIDLNTWLTIADMMVGKKNRSGAKASVGVYIVNLTSSPYQYIQLQNRPFEVRADNSTQWATINSMGRNVPMYHFTGAEDTLTFRISWYASSKEHPDEVVNKCRLLESWSKANGYTNSPPILKLMFGFDGPFVNHDYILWSAPYELKNFGVFQYDQKEPSSNRIINPRYFPMVATQELTFKRVSDHNPTWEDIIPNSKLQYTNGVKLNATESEVANLN